MWTWFRRKHGRQNLVFLTLNWRQNILYWPLADLYWVFPFYKSKYLVHMVDVLSSWLICFCVIHAVLAIVLVGLLYGFFIAIICGQRINERHYHVLAKQELTKVSYLILTVNLDYEDASCFCLCGKELLFIKIAFCINICNTSSVF